MLKLQIFGPLSKEVRQRNLNGACLGFTGAPLAFLLLLFQVTQERFFQSALVILPKPRKMFTLPLS